MEIVRKVNGIFFIHRYIVYKVLFGAVVCVGGGEQWAGGSALVRWGETDAAHLASSWRRGGAGRQAWNLTQALKGTLNTACRNNNNDNNSLVVSLRQNINMNKLT